jgi:hypothetical protein
MRKIKIFLTTLAVAGVLFATTSCVDNTESESVSALREAKAAQLNALAQHYKDDDANNKILAEAQALVARANADLLASQTVLAASQVKLNEANAQAILLQAEANKLRAEGDKAVSEALAKQYEAQADQTVKQAQAEADRAAEALRITKYNNDLTIAKLQWDLAKAELEAKASLLTQQQAYIQAVNALGITFTAEHNALIGQKTTVLNNITTLKAQIANYELNIVGYKWDLAFYSIDSAKFVAQFKAEKETEIALADLDLKHAERELALWESIPTGLDDTYLTDVNGEITLDIEGLNSQKARIINDTLETSEALALAVAAAAELEADTVAKTAALEAAKEALEPVEAAYDAAIEVVDAAREDYNAYLGLSADVAYITNSLVESSWTYKGGWTTETYPNETMWPTFWTSSYTGQTYHAPVNPYNYSNNQVVIIYSDNKIEVSCLIDLDYPYGSGGVDYYFRVYTKNQVVGTTESKYTSAEDYEHHIQLWKQDSIDAKKTYGDISKVLSDSLVSLKALGALERTLYNQLQDSIRILDEAIEALDAAEAAYNAAVDKYTATPNQPNLNALDIANVAYNGFKYSDGSEVATANGGALGARDRAITYRANAQNKYNNAETAYANTNGSIHGLIDGVIAANNAVALVNAKLAPAYDNLEVLKKGTREQLQFALEAAIEATEAPYEAYLAELELVTVAQDSLDNAKDAYETYVDGGLLEAQHAYNLAAKAYLDVEEIDFLISLGGTKALLTAKAEKLEEILGDIADAEETIARTQLILVDVTKTSNFVSAVEATYEGINNSIKYYEQLIANREVQIAANERLADSYQKAIDILVAAYDSLSE